MHALLEQNRISGSRHPENRLFLEALETGQPVKETGKPNCLLHLSVHIRFTGFQFRKAGFGFLLFCILTGLPVRKSGKPDSCLLNLLKKAVLGFTTGLPVIHNRQAELLLPTLGSFPDFRICFSESRFRLCSNLSTNRLAG